MSPYGISRPQWTNKSWIWVRVGPIIKLLWPNDAIWWHTSGSTLAQVMACCLTAPSHNLNQCLLPISDVLWHPSESNFTAHAQATFEVMATPPRDQWVNSLAPGRFYQSFSLVVFKFILAIDGWDISHEISSKWMSLDLTDDNSTLVQLMAWCRQATSHYLSQCWPRSVAIWGH